jgi:hypothetical protein
MTYSVRDALSAIKPMMILQTTLLAAHHKIKPPLAAMRILGDGVLVPIAGVANKNNENGNHPSHDEHPILDVKTKN